MSFTSNQSPQSSQSPQLAQAPQNPQTEAAQTLVLQSHRLPLPHPWLNDALASVRDWAQQQGFAYEFIDDKLFEVLNEAELECCQNQPVVASDLARLRWCQRRLGGGYERVVWCAADTLVIDPDELRLSSASSAFGRELWLQTTNSRKPKLKIYKKIHNAFMQFTALDPVLDFYAYSAERLIRNHRARSNEPHRPMVVQLAGPKFLTHLHNVLAFDVVETAQVLSPPLAHALLNDDQAVLDLYSRAADQAPAAFNLCCSEVHRETLSDDDITRLIDRLLQNH